MLDFTQEIHLTSEWQKRYRRTQAALCVLFIGGGLLFARTLFFPTFAFDIPLDNQGSQLETTRALRDLATGQALSDGSLSNKATYAFNANFDRPRAISKAMLNARLAENGDKNPALQVTVRKGYRAFFAEEGEPLGFKNGSLLKSGDSFYLVSGEKLRKFATEKILRDLGYKPDMFMEVSPDDLAFNSLDREIDSVATYPNDVLIKIGEVYYRFQDNSLIPFASKEAFLSHYDPSLAILKNEAFLADKKIATDNKIGFADGTLVSTDSGILIVSAGKKYPVGSPQIFEAMGFDWNDVVASSEGALAAYTKESLFTQHSVHPDGTIFHDRQAGKYFLLSGSLKHPLLTPAIAKSHLRHKPVLVSERSLTEKKDCVATDNPLADQNFSCAALVEELQDLPGNGYQFELTTGSTAKLDSLSVKLQTAVDRGNFLGTLAVIKQNIITNYYGQTK